MGDEQQVETDFSPERIAHLAKVINTKIDETISQIRSINIQTHVLSLNARVEAARAGAAGEAFEVVAAEMGALSGRTSEVSDVMANETKEAISELSRISEDLSTNVRGVRLGDLALTNIDLIDRNLYERSCDVRWWATDSSVVDALTQNTKEACQFASFRLGQILDSYTVYYDLVLCELDGRVVARGKQRDYGEAQGSQKDSEWFKTAINTKSGTDYGFETVHRNSLVNNNLVLVYSCAVRKEGKVDSDILGVLGIIFNWEGLAQTIVHEIPLSDQEKMNSRVCIFHRSGMILADSNNRQLEQKLDFASLPAIIERQNGFLSETYRGEQYCIGFAASPGYETYNTGWHSLIAQKL